MWKILLAFVVFAGAALFIIFKAGDKVDMQGEAGAHNPTELHAAPSSSASSANSTAPAANQGAGK